MELKTRKNIEMSKVILMIISREREKMSVLSIKKLRQKTFQWQQIFIPYVAWLHRHSSVSSMPLFVFGSVMKDES